MKTEMTTTSVTVSCSPTDSTKLASLLAVAAGAIAMPQTGNADIIFKDLSSSPVEVGFLGGTDKYTLELPGAVLFGFERSQRTTSTTSSIFFVRSVVAADMFGIGATAKIQAGANGIPVPLAYGAAWNAGGLPLTFTATVGWATTYNRQPAGYDHQYVGFRFQDSTAGNQLRYGWIELGLSVTFVNPVGGVTGGPNVTIYGYGWDNNGAQPFMGQKPVPEPSSAALLVIGALALGAPGLRKWRQNRDQASNS